jgi:hypothetical protein
MIKQLHNVPSNLVAFSAEGEVTEADFKEIVFPAVEKLVKKTGKLNYLMVVNTSLANFKPGAWWQDMILGLKEFTKWERVAILSDSKMLNTFTNMFSVVVPGEFKGFVKNDLAHAIEWVSKGK